MVIDLGISQVTLFLAARDQVLQLLGLLTAANCCSFFAQDETAST
jgi:hypothetical protein